MQRTIGEVKEVARRLWPAAAELNVHIIAATPDTPKRYRVSAISEHRAILGRITADDLNGLQTLLEQRPIVPAFR